MADSQGDSPTRFKHTHDAEYRALHVADSHTTLARDIPMVPEVQLDSLMDAVLPSLSPEELESTFEALVAGRHIKSPDTDNARWSCLPRDPRTSRRPEDKTFKFLEEIAKAIKESHAPANNKWVTLSITGQVTPVSFRHNTSRPDGFIHFKQPASIPVAWADIILTMEFKNKYDENQNIDDFAKVILSMQHIMRADARRRYVYGLSCENTKARLWYNDRSDILVSTEFDVNKDWKHLVRIILSLMLASPAQLGYDPTMVALNSDDGRSEPAYNITIYNSDTQAATQYCTIRMLSDVGAESPVSRGTRVWEVRKLVEGVLVGRLHALKDMWIHETCHPEHQMLVKIRKDQPEYSEQLLTPLDHGYVPHDLAEPSIPDNTHKTLRRRKLEPTGKVLRTHALPTPRPTETISRNTKSASRDSVGHHENIPNSSWKEDRNNVYLSKDPRQHYRMVVEVGELPSTTAPSKPKLVFDGVHIPPLKRRRAS